jgi:hypothetical protein
MPVPSIPARVNPDALMQMLKQMLKPPSRGRLARSPPRPSRPARAIDANAPSHRPGGVSRAALPAPHTQRSKPPSRGRLARSPPRPSHLAPAIDAHKVGDGPIVGALRLRREHASRQLAHPQMIADTLAALALPGARLVRAGALCHIIFDSALHIPHPQDYVDRRKYSTNQAKAKGHRRRPVALCLCVSLRGTYAPALCCST